MYFVFPNNGPGDSGPNSGVVSIRGKTLDGKYVFSVFAPDPKYTVYLVYLEEGGENTPPWCIMCICFKVKYTVYLVYFEGCLCVFPI